MVEKTTYFLGFLSLLLLIGFIIILVLYIDRTKNTTTSSAVPKLYGIFGLTPNVDPTNVKIQNTCSGNPDGIAGALPCNFSGITNLKDATDLCNSYSSDKAYAACNGFIYNSSDNTMSIIIAGYNYTSETTPSVNNGDVYQRQTNF